MQLKAVIPWIFDHTRPKTMQTVRIQHAVTIRKYKNVSSSSAYARISSSGNATMILADKLNWKVEFGLANRVRHWLATSVIDN
ncbi:MAG: hypothetical protein WBR14_17645 [Candidatus Acidiferrum sp.]